jgi:acyl carrier protein
MSNLTQEIKELIIECLDLEDTTPDDIKTNEPLFGEGLGLDSIDALELGLSIYKKYNVKLDSHSKQTQEIFYSVANLAAYIESSVAKQAG